jgi:hypothetical protein
VEIGWLLTEAQRRARGEFAAFVETQVVPYADDWDRQEAIPAGFVADLAGRGYLGGLVPAEHGGPGLDQITFGLLSEALGAGCAAARSVLTVHGMVIRAISRWGTAPQRDEWLGRLAAGSTVAGFALTEPGAGSDAAAIAATARRDGTGFVLDGVKRWVTYGRRATLFLVFARLAGRDAAFLVERDRPGLVVAPIDGLLGARASMLAELRFQHCRVPAAALVGRPGFGLSTVAADALELGRYSVAWGCVGLAQACLDATVRYTGQREQFGTRLSGQPLVQRMVADMVTGVAAARLLCYQAGRLREAGAPESVPATWVAKYFAADRAFRTARDAVQCHGAAGCSDAHPVQRHFRDAKVMEIIEGSTELQQTVIAGSAYRLRPDRAGAA